MTRCKRCGHLNNSENGFCESCGARLRSLRTDETEILEDTPQGCGSGKGARESSTGRNRRSADPGCTPGNRSGRAVNASRRGGYAGADPYAAGGWSDMDTVVDPEPGWTGGTAPSGYPGGSDASFGVSGEQTVPRGYPRATGSVPPSDGYQRVYLCPNCGAPMRPGDRFCVSCGSGFDGPAGFVDPYGQAPADHYDNTAGGSGPYGYDPYGNQGYGSGNGARSGKMKSVLSLIAICVAAGLLMAGVVYFLMNRDSGPDENAAETETTTTQAAEQTRPTQTAQEPTAQPTRPTQPATQATQPTRSYSSDPYDGEIHQGDICPSSSVAYLDYDDYGYLDDDSLDIAINEIYARHGAMFKDRRIQGYFDSQYWYVPTVPADQVKSGALNSHFNKYEKTNIDDMAAERKARQDAFD